MRRILLVVALAVTATTVGASAARADQPLVVSYDNFPWFYPASDHFTFGPGALCPPGDHRYGTEIRIETEGQRLTTFADGQALVTGPLKITVSRVTWTGSTSGLGQVATSIDLNISGPGRAAPGADGKLHTTLLLGPSLILLPTGPPWLGGHLFYLTGRTLVGPGLGDYGFEQQGGTLLDVCEALGPWSD